MTNDKNEMDFSGHLKHLEDAQDVQLPVDDKTLTDSELEQAGLVKTSAFVRTKKSKNALRIEKHKQKKAENGVKQLNIEVPEQYRDIFKAIAKELKENGTVSQENMAIFPMQSGDNIKSPESKKTAQQKSHTSEKSSLSDECVKIGQKCAEIVSQGGFKAWFLKKIV